MRNLNDVRGNVVKAEPVKVTESRNKAKNDLIDMESLAPKKGFHAWVVKQESDGDVDVYVAESFTKFTQFLKGLNRVKFMLGEGESIKPTAHYWIDVQSLDEEELRSFGVLLQLHELTIEDMVCGNK